MGVHWKEGTGPLLNINPYPIISPSFISPFYPKCPSPHYSPSLLQNQPVPLSSTSFTPLPAPIPLPLTLIHDCSLPHTPLCTLHLFTTPPYPSIYPRDLAPYPSQPVPPLHHYSIIPYHASNLLHSPLCAPPCPIHTF